MGTGSSRGSPQVVAADASLNEENNGGSRNKNMEQLGEASNLGDEIRDDAVKADDQNSVTHDVDSSLSSSDPLLTSFSETYPAIAKILRTTYDDYKVLKDALDNGNLISKTTLDQAQGLVSVYRKVTQNKSTFREFVVALGIPKLSYDIVVDCRENYPELTTWDRGKAKENAGEENETEQNNEEDGNQPEQINMKEKNETEMLVQGDSNQQQIVEDVNEKEQAAVALEEGDEVSTWDGVLPGDVNGRWRWTESQYFKTGLTIMELHF